MILVDSNIPMYLVGTDHPLKLLSQQLLQRHVMLGDQLVTDAEVYQEILHRYTAIQRPSAIDDAFAVLSSLAETVFPIEFSDVERARGILASGLQVSARDSLHLAIMEHHGITHILSFDAGLDHYPGIVRVHELDD